MHMQKRSCFCQNMMSRAVLRFRFGLPILSNLTKAVTIRFMGLVVRNGSFGFATLPSLSFFFGILNGNMRLLQRGVFLGCLRDAPSVAERRPKTEQLARNRARPRWLAGHSCLAPVQATLLQLSCNSSATAPHPLCAWSHSSCILVP